MVVGNEGWSHFWGRRIRVVVLIAVLVIYGLGVVAVHGDSHGHALHEHEHDHHDHCDGGHGHRGHHHHHHHHEDEHQHVGHDVFEKDEKRRKLPEELAEEEDLKLYGFGGGNHHHDDDHHLGAAGDAELSGIGLWIHAMGCSLLVSLASLICLIILPLIFIQGKPSKAVVDSLALFGAGAMLGDAFLHQLPHAFGGEHSHSHDHHADHAHHHSQSGHEDLPLHSHSLKDLSVGLSILAGIILFLLVEKLVRYVEDSSGGVGAWSHGHYHHHKQNKKLKADDDADENVQELPLDEKSRSSSGMLPEEKVLDRVSADIPNGEKQTENAVLQKRNTGGAGGAEDKADVSAANGYTSNIQCTEKEPAKSSSNLVFGYLNLFSDGVHNFSDGMALGSAFLLYGSIGGWSRTLFLLAHELPQEIGDFGILVRSGFTIAKALFFNFLSALVALAGTALALMMGQDPGQSSLIEGFTAGGFIYIAVAGVLAEMNTGSSSLKSTVIQLVSLMMGMVVALGISLVE